MVSAAHDLGQKVDMGLDRSMRAGWVLKCGYCCQDFGKKIGMGLDRSGRAEWMLKCGYCCA